MIDLAEASAVASKLAFAISRLRRIERLLFIGAIVGCVSGTAFAVLLSFIDMRYVRIFGLFGAQLVVLASFMMVIFRYHIYSKSKIAKLRAALEGLLSEIFRCATGAIDGSQLNTTQDAFATARELAEQYTLATQVRMAESIQLPTFLDESFSSVDYIEKRLKPIIDMYSVYIGRANRVVARIDRVIMANRILFILMFAPTLLRAVVERLSDSSVSVLLVSNHGPFIVFAATAPLIFLELLLQDLVTTHRRAVEVWSEAVRNLSSAMGDWRHPSKMDADATRLWAQFVERCENAILRGGVVE